MEDPKPSLDPGIVTNMRVSGHFKPKYIRVVTFMDQYGEIKYSWQHYDYMQNAIRSISEGWGLALSRGAVEVLSGEIYFWDPGVGSKRLIEPEKHHG